MLHSASEMIGTSTQPLFPPMSLPSVHVFVNVLLPPFNHNKSIFSMPISARCMQYALAGYIKDLDKLPNLLEND